MIRKNQQYRIVFQKSRKKVQVLRSTGHCGIRANNEAYKRENKDEFPIDIPISVSDARLTHYQAKKTKHVDNRNTKTPRSQKNSHWKIMDKVKPQSLFDRWNQEIIY